MAIIVVGGSSKGAGKTALVCGLIEALAEFQWTAIKITTEDHGQPTPIWEETAASEETDTGALPGRGGGARVSGHTAARGGRGAAGPDRGAG